jgi:hypothetical protein
MGAKESNPAADLQVSLPLTHPLGNRLVFLKPYLQSLRN